MRESQMTTARTASGSAAAPGRVLVVDDAALVRAYYRHALEAEGFEVEEAFNGIEGLEKALATPFDLVVVDVHMPKMDGHTFVGKLRETDELACLPVLMTSTLDRDRDVAAAHAVGVNLYLVKPVNDEELRLSARIMTGAGAR